MTANKLTVLGVMSGTSLDGLDLALVTFDFDKAWSFSIIHAQTIPYSKAWRNRLATAAALSRQQIAHLDHDYTVYISNQINGFLDRYSFVKVDFVSSHGHTVLHQPQDGLTYQIGNLPVLAQRLGTKLICDFRSADVALNGQGAPLVPGAEIHLFSEYAACVNLGGFANISLLDGRQTVAFDICGVNVVLNRLAEKKGHSFDPDGAMAQSGQLLSSLFTQLNALSYYDYPPPKSLGVEWVAANITPLLAEHYAPEDVLHTYCHHVAEQISKVLPTYQQTLFTGGGCYNNFLMQLIREKATAEIVLPAQSIIEFKEAIAFAFLGVLKHLNRPNCLSRVTGAVRDHTSGVIFFP
ncbi:MAG: anhydro-N-acetylmuramic acid kinase [Flavobacteriaceae bacterium]